MARKPRKPLKPRKADIKAAADRAAKRSKGEDVTSPKVDVDPTIVLAEAIRGMGRPTEYKAEFSEQARKWYERGATDDEVANLLGVSRQTVYRWRIQHEDFCYAAKIGKEIADDRVERSLYEKAVGYTIETEKLFHHAGLITRATATEFVHPDPQSIKLWLTNRKAASWSDTTKREVSGPGGGPIVVADVSKLELARWIALQLTQVQALTVVE